MKNLNLTLVPEIDFSYSDIKKPGIYMNTKFLRFDLESENQKYSVIRITRGENANQQKHIFIYGEFIEELTQTLSIDQGTAHKLIQKRVGGGILQIENDFCNIHGSSLEYQEEQDREITQKILETNLEQPFKIKK